MAATDFDQNFCEIVTSDDLFAETSQWWAEQCEGVDTIVHLAWYAEPGKYLHSSKNMDCLEGSLKLARGAGTSRRKGVLSVWVPVLNMTYRLGCCRLIRR
jgi:dTDP-6-deoxy-L-talose 4-dehydrogenase (NAD+)